MTVQDTKNIAIGDRIFSDIRAEFEEISRPVWEGLLITEEPPEVEPLIRITGVSVVLPGEHILVLGKKKSRKSLFISWLLSHHPHEAIIFDTEQSRRSAWRVGDRVQRLSKVAVPVVTLRGKSPAERRQIIAETVSSWETRISIVVIDGIRDLIGDINDPKQATDLIVWLEALVRDHSVAVVNVLHLNKSNDNARGHIGTELQNKAYCSIELSLHTSGVTMVRCESSRDEPFRDFAFTHNSEGLPEVVPQPVNGQQMTSDDQKTVLKFVATSAGEILSYGDLLEALKIHFKVGMNKAKQLAGEFNRNGWVVKSGNEGTKTIYKILV